MLFVPQRLALVGVVAGLVAWQTAAARGADLPAADHEFFESRVRPLLVAHCVECHSAEAGDPEGGLSFDSRADFLTTEGLAVAGDPDRSLIVQAVRYDGSLQMPPEGKLPAEAIATIEEWVRRGLPWPDDGKAASVSGFDMAARKAAHWCWQPPRQSVPPDVRDPAWCRGEIDRFVLARLESAGMAPAAEAEPAVLVRRAAEVLTGLPADPAEVETVAADPDPTAFERYVDRLLASPHYGERFGRHWLDVVRYAESRGHEFDFDIPDAWRYRDWVVAAFNADLPYDRFIREQLAGDLVADPRLDANGANESIVGTGFWFLGEEVHSPVDILQDEADRVDNRIDTFGKAFLGLTLGCARCHDHKFDAISTADYYAIAGMLMSSSYRQVPFESLESNRAVAAEAEDVRAASQDRLLPLVGELLVTVPDAAAALPTSAELATSAAECQISDARREVETQIADYTRGDAATPLILDAAAWSLAPIGQVRSVSAEGGPRVELAGTSVARSDAVWSQTSSQGGREPGAIGQVDRAGRILRTPKVRLSQGVLWHRVRGHLQIVSVVDSHRLIHGPLYGTNVMQVDTQGEWRWVRQDLKRDLRWIDTSHVVHVEYAAIAGAAEVAEVVAASEEPVRPDPFVAAFRERSTPPLDTLRELQAGLVNACREGRSLPPEQAILASRLLASPQIDWSAGVARQLADESAQTAAAEEAVFSRARRASATVAAILDGNGIDQFVLVKGSAARPGSSAPRRFLEAIDGGDQPPWPTDSSGRRELADRVLAADNPLTARVAVNRIWHHLFGRGLVATPDNFGLLGEPPADPLAQALLDTLAVRFVQEGWSVKRLVREIVTSSTWRMSSIRSATAAKHDPLNILLHCAPIRRLEGEAIRDKILAVSGRLDPQVGGPSVPVHLTEFHAGRGRPTPGPMDGAGRRSIYTAVRRNFLPGFLVAFDYPVPFQTMGRRTVTNVPAQPLTLMNDPFVVEQAHRWSARVLAYPGLSPSDRIDRMYREAFARPPEPEETEDVLEFLTAQTTSHSGDVTTDQAVPAAWAALAHALINAKEFSFVP